MIEYLLHLSVDKCWFVQYLKMNNYQNIYIFIISPLTGVRATLISEKASCFLGGCLCICCCFNLSKWTVG